MLTLRKAEDRGHADHGWLDTHHTFSFGDYYDEGQMGFGPLRVINDDTVAPGGGFPPHGHRDMEIISYVLSGAIQHKDSMGNGSVIKPGDVQRMSAGKGVTHSEFNASQKDPVHFLQIWVIPTQPGGPPGYEQKFFSDDDKRGVLRLVASQTGEDGSVKIQQDARLFATLLEKGASVQHTIPAGRKGWIHIATGNADVNGRKLAAGDGLAIEGEEKLTLRSEERGEVLLFDMTQ
jgi:redox-sensitive bicupin YhaK (pirin superfamily)